MGVSTCILKSPEMRSSEGKETKSSRRAENSEMNKGCDVGGGR